MSDGAAGNREQTRQAAARDARRKPTTKQHAARLKKASKVK